MKTKILALLLIMIFTSCSLDDVVYGSGNLIEQQVTISSFDKIEIISSAAVNLTQANTQSVVLIADDNIINDISTEVRNNTLIIKYKYDNINYRHTSTTLNITLPAINNINVTGSSRFAISNFNDLSNLTVKNTGSMDMLFSNFTNLNEFHLKNTGSLKFRANGTIQKFFISNSGSQKISCFDFITNKCTISNSGSGRIEVFCNDSLNITNTGSIDIYYKGHPSLIIHDTGSGHIENAN